ncbi:3741_t:CDS:10 [Paraglomus brasilianum]|uniref:Protein HGH1 homolog n=1 Tax=Paraglomus brasilianum TaxID=144538 RepID=A0A9N9BPY8_9GLOM|nr:3741_t:CDS:10 [Paraglomus brasilianum]
MEKDLSELLEFLHDQNQDARRLALKALLGYTAPASEFQSIFKSNAMKPVQDLKSLCRNETLIAHDAFKALINLSGDKDVCRELSEDNYIGFVIGTITNAAAVLADLACMLLSNTTKHELAAKKILDAEIQPTDELSSSTRAIDQLLDAFVKGANSSYNKNANFHFLASVFADVTILPQGRDYFTTPAGYDGVIPLAKLVVFTEHQNIIRRGGVISAIKNCCFAIDKHNGLLDESNINLLPYILLPLCGPEEFSDEDMEGMPEEIQLLAADKTREPDARLRQTLVETLLLLTTTRPGRVVLRKKKVYPVVRQMHLVEGDDATKEAIERLVNMLMRDEQNGSSKIDNIMWDRSEEIANSQINIKINLVDDITNSTRLVTDKTTIPLTEFAISL